MSTLKALLASAGIFLIGITCAAAQEFTLHSAPFGTGSYVMGSALEQVVKQNHSSIRVNHSESPGFVFNHKNLDGNPDLRKNTIIGSGKGVNAAAAAGQTPFEKKTTQVLLLANYNVGGQWLATLDKNIKTVADLKGKTVGLGRRPQINWTIQPEAMMRVGWGLEDSVKVEYLGIKQAVTALLDGQVDAAVLGAYFNPVTKDMQLSPQTQEFLASGRSVHFVDWGHDAVKKVVDTGMPMLTMTVEADAIEGNDKPLDIYGDTVSWMVHADFPEEAAYEITKLIINNLEAFGKAHALGKLMTPEMLPFGWDKSEIHPGALRAYQEAGLID